MDYCAHVEMFMGIAQRSIKSCNGHSIFTLSSTIEAFYTEEQIKLKLTQLLSILVIIAKAFSLEAVVQGSLPKKLRYY